MHSGRGFDTPTSTISIFADRATPCEKDSTAGRSILMMGVNWFRQSELAEKATR